MKKLLSRCAAVVTGALLLVPTTPASAIVGGAPDAGEHPYVGQLLFYVPDAVDPRFDDPGGWFNCTGTLIDADTVVTAGHCTYDVGVEGEAPADPLFGGTDVWFSVSEAPDYSCCRPARPSCRMATTSATRPGRRCWTPATMGRGGVDVHPSRVRRRGVPAPRPRRRRAERADRARRVRTLPEANYLDQYAGRAKQQALFESVGYGLEDSGPKFSFGGDTRRKADRRLISFKGAYGYRDIAVMFSHARAARPPEAPASATRAGRRSTSRPPRSRSRT